MPAISLAVHQSPSSSAVSRAAFSTAAALVVVAGVESKITVMLAILLVSLFAVSFPSISKQVPFLRVPQILFFVGKHFGTGVILATAFIHLLDDAFRSLQKPAVEARYGRVGRWTGGIILLSLLAIFLVEYISTSYVEHLHGKPSAPPTPIERTPLGSREPSPARKVSETTPLLSVPPTQTARRPNTSRTRSSTSQRRCRLAHGVRHGYGHEGECEYDDDSSSSDDESEADADADMDVDLVVTVEVPQPPQSQSVHPRIGRRRQVVGILVLQLGIMIHSLVIGLTLAVTSGSDFTSLTTAIIFHQLFEGFSLGIRIAGLPPPESSRPHNRSVAGDDPDCTEVVEDEEMEDRHFGSGSDQTLLDSEANEQQNGQHSKKVVHRAHCTKRSPLWSSWRRCLPWLRPSRPRQTPPRTQGVQWLQPTLSFLFAVTTPLGMGLGMLVFPKDKSEPSGGGKTPEMLLIQGVMSAISAGLLIYAATVEMLAGDFVFGDVDGGHGHGGGGGGVAHGHGHGHGQGHNHTHTHNHAHTHPHTHRADSEDSDGGPGDELGSETPSPKASKASVGKRAVAVVSLFMGAGMMVLVGLGEGH